jgi:hypothetical protein
MHAGIPPAWRVLLPARGADATPPSCRDRFERASFRREWTLEWRRLDAADGFTTLSLMVWDSAMMPVRRTEITRRTEGFDEAAVAEGLCDWIMDPRPRGEDDGSGERPGDTGRNRGNR